MKKYIPKEQVGALVDWEAEGGATAAHDHVSGRGLITDAAQERKDVDARHVSGERGEHRYPDAGQTPRERQARQERDDLKRVLGRPRASGGCR